MDMMRTYGSWMLSVVMAVAMLGLMTDRASALSVEDHTKATEAIDKAIAYFRQTQNEDGSWSPRAGPAITGLVVAGMLDQPGIGPNDPTVRRAIQFILSKVQEDGGIYDGMLPNYNTSISVSALSRVRGDRRIAEVLENAEKFLRSLQYMEGSVDAQGRAVTEDHPFRGGFGYGNHGRPDGSNTQMTAQAFRDLGIDCNDPAFQEIVRYTSRLQAIPENEFLRGKVEMDGGAIYATSINKDLIGVPQSFATPEAREAAIEGKPMPPLRTYGSMSYAMIKTYIYADLKRDDPRVIGAYNWIRNNYTVEHNPGMPEELKHNGYFYYLMTMARALHAWNAPVLDKDDQPILWQSDMVRKLVSLQREDGSWINEADRWMEGDVNLVTAYALIAINNALGRER
ncbi:MAG: terpene cyclase/mutase family protein [Phycisphaeraceae bacterium]|nr:terpene cyclase/mutase family protein [Phycisphaeraceae bacterium]